MFNRLKQALVDSYVGAIALGWLLAQGVLHFIGIFTAPVAGWIMRNQYRGFAATGTEPVGFSFKDGVPELVRSFFLLLACYLFLRWLYFKPVKHEKTLPEQAA